MRTSSTAVALTGMTPAGAMAERLQVDSACADEPRSVLAPLLNPEPLPEEEQAESGE